MKSLVEFLKQFLSNQGHLVFMSSIITKFSMLIVTIIASHLISPQNYGLIILILSVFSMFTPLVGLGFNQGLLRFGILENDEKIKQELSDYVFWKGFFHHIFITLIYLVVCLIYALKYDGVWAIIIFFGIRLLGYYFFNHTQSHYRMLNDNKTYSKMNITVDLSGIFLVAVLTYIFGMMGYLVAMAIIPWISIVYFKKMKSFFPTRPSINFKEFRRYSFHASMTYFFSDLLFSMDFILIGFLLDETSVAFYKNAVMLPMSISFLPLIFMQTDYPKLVKNFKDWNYLNFYLVNYYKIFIPLGIIILIVGYFVKDWIVPFVFGEYYAGGNGWVFFTILIALVGNMWMRNVYGNMTAAVGKAHWNTYISLGALFIILILGILLIPSYGIMGAAIGMAVAFLFTGFLGMLLFHNYLRNLKSEKN